MSNSQSSERSPSGTGNLDSSSLLRYSEDPQLDEETEFAVSPEAERERPIRRKRKARAPTSWVWGSGDCLNGMIVTIAGEEAWKCNRCSQTYPKKHGTHHPAQHLIRVHHLEEPLNAKTKRLQSSQSSIQESLQRAAGKAAQKEVQRNRERELEFESRREQYPSIAPRVMEDLYTKLIVVHDLPLTLPTWPEFHAILQAIRPEVANELPTSSSTVAAWSNRTFDQQKVVVRTQLENSLSQIHITLDIWTSPNMISLLGVIGHFTDSGGKLNRALLGLREIDGMKSGENICETFIQIATDFEIRHKLGYFMMDNATNNDTFMHDLQERQEEFGLDFDAIKRRLRCNGHVINLSVQSFLFGKDSTSLEDTGVDMETIMEDLDRWRQLGPLGKAHNIAVHSRRSPERLKQFRKFSGGLLIKRDNSTRWNSWAETLESILRPEIKHAIRDYIDEYDELEQDRPTKEDWNLYTKVHRILSDFKQATKATEGTNDTLTTVLPSFDFLLNTYSLALDEAHAEGDVILSSMIRIGWEKLDKYYAITAKAPVYLAAVVLHPRFKWRYFEQKWSKQWVLDSRESLLRYWQQYKATVVNTQEEEEVEDLSVAETSDFAKWMNLESLDTDGDSAMDDYGRYCANAIPERYVNDALSWWIDPRQQTEYPILSHWAVNIHSIPAMSSEPERVFSGAKRTVTDHKHSMTAASIEKRQCLKSWIQMVKE